MFTGLRLAAQQIVSGFPQVSNTTRSSFPFKSAQINCDSYVSWMVLKVQFECEKFYNQLLLHCCEICEEPASVILCCEIFLGSANRAATMEEA